ncbi:hypothetical protein, partial [Komagataeibacter sp. FNDCF1]|uniref:hypothetical protein n=1 Tax=Komagataeibacter sp. FNDCF1 TaxID=2878681 RepID=UPI001E5CA8C6
MTINKKDIEVSYNCHMAAIRKNNPLNVYLVILCKDLPVYTVHQNSTQKQKEKNRLECIRYVLNFLRNFSRSKLHKFDLYYLLTLEMTPAGGRGLHLNILLHIPNVVIGRYLQEKLYKMFDTNEEEWINMKMKPFFLKGAKDF